MAHKGHPACSHTTKAACDKAQREALGRCTELVAGKRKNDEPHECQNWARSLVEGRPFCDTHAGAILERELAHARLKARMASVREKIDAYIAGQQARWQETLDWERGR